MADDSDIDKRLADQVTSLSTQLVTEVAKSSHLEETILQLRRQNSAYRTKLSSAPSATQLEALQEKYEALTESHKALEQEKSVAEEKNKQLEAEVEDLTASLFNEANEMVSNASREAYNFKLKNRKLIEELGEKDSIIDNLQNQLRDLKDLIVKMEDTQTVSRSNTPKVDNGRFPGDNDTIASHAVVSDDMFVLHQVIYGVRGTSIRFDLPSYQLNFKAFIYQLIKKDFTFDLASLKSLKYFRKLWNEEIEPSVPVIPSLSGNNFINRWSKGITFWNLLVEGRAIIEPVAGVNETFKLSYRGIKSGSEVPVAMKEPCSFCGESKDDLLEHARLYNLKLYGPATLTGASSGNTTMIGGEAHAVIGNYPLCNFCLVKLRAICTFFAKLRLVHANIYKLKQNYLYDDVAYVNNFQFKRSSESLQTPSSDPEEEPIFLKLYLMLLSLRAKIFWTRIGFWDTEDDVESLNVDEIQIETFRGIVQENVAFRQPDMAPVLQGSRSNEREITEQKDHIHEKDQDKTAEAAEAAEESTSKSVDKLPKAKQHESLEEAAELSKTASIKNAPNTQASPTKTESKSSKKAKKKNRKAPAKRSPSPEKVKSATGITRADEEDDGDSDFQDTSETLESQVELSRRRSKSKDFKAKIDKDWEDTMAMLQESIE